MKKLLFLLPLFFSVSIAFADTQTNPSLNNKTNELHQVTQQIQGLQSAISQDKNKKTVIQGDLKNIETHISSIANILVQTNTQLQQQNNILTQLHQKEVQYQTLLQQQASELSQNIRTAYILDQNGYLKLVLNQQDPNKIARTLMYYSYVNNARLKIMSELQQTLGNLNNTEQQIERHNLLLHDLLSKQQKQQATLQSQYSQRQNVLVQVSSSIQTKAQKLTTLMANKKALEQLITQLREASTYFPQPNGPFTKMRGKLPWPVKGNISEHFGSSLDGTNILSTGIFISAPINQPVRAIYPGRVVFADWLRGLGELVIIQHGGGYMTLYGGNHSLYKKVGDIVQAGDIIASVGENSSNDKTGLYFQIRANGQPLNPESWCK